jgi:hypothetical protein
VSRFALCAAVAGLLVSETRHLADEALCDDTDRLGVTLAKRGRRLGFVYDLLGLSLSGWSRVRICIIGEVESAVNWCGTGWTVKKSDSESESENTSLLCKIY